MATVLLDRVWINLVSTGAAVSAFTADRGRVHAMEGDVRTYAGGRRRAITVEGIQEQFACTLRQLSAATVATLVEWMGQAVQVRDHRGMLIVGVFFAVIPIEQIEPTIWDAAIVVRVVSTEEV